MSRPFYPGGPAHATHNSATVQFAEDWDASNEPEFFDISTSSEGVVDTRQKNAIGKVTGTPIGIYGGTTISRLYPWQPSQRGQLLFSSTDLPFVIQTKAGKSITYPAAALSKSPAVTFSAMKVLFSAAEWTILLAGGADGTTAGDFATVATSAYTAPSLTPAAILTGRYTAAWGDSPSGSMANIRTESGITFTPTYQWTPVVDDGQIVNYRLESVTVEVTFTPINLTETDLYGTLMPMDGTGTGAGSSRSGVGGLFTVTGSAPGMPVLTIPTSFASKSSLRFGKEGRVGPVTLRAMRKSSSGTLQDMYTLSTVSA